MEIKGGYYIKARKIQNSAIAKAPPHIREIWDWILKECNHQDTQVCQRGQCVRSYSDIIEGLKWYIGWRKMTYTKHHCEIAMKWLKKATMITTKKTTRGMIITVVKYDYYQTAKNYESHNENLTKATRKPQSTDTINKNEKNNKNNEVCKQTSPSKKNMKNYEEPTIDYDSNEPLKEEIKEPRNIVAFRLQKKFKEMAKKELGIEPIHNKVGYILLCRALKIMSEKDIITNFEDWFNEAKNEEDLIQITQALSTNRLNKWRIQNN